MYGRRFGWWCLRILRRRKTSDHFSNLPLGEVYAIGLDMDSPYHVYAAASGSRKLEGPGEWAVRARLVIEDWVTLNRRRHVQRARSARRWLYNTQEFGKPARVDQELHTRTIITPTRPRASHSFAATGSRRFEFLRTTGTPSITARRCCFDPKICVITGRSQPRSYYHDPAKISQPGIRLTLHHHHSG